MNPQSSPKSSWAGLALFGIGVLALLSRLPWLGRLGLYGDEDISTLAARGIGLGGLPRLPSGHLYWRSPLYHYLAAPLAATGIDWLPRLLSVVVSMACALLLVRLGRRWVGERAALLGAFLFSVSLVEIHLARQVRFYALYQLVALLALAALYLFWVSGERRWGLLALAAVLASLSVHELGATLAVLFLVVAVRARETLVRAASVAAAVLVGLASLIQQRLTVAMMYGGHDLVSSVPGLAAGEAEEFQAPFVHLFTWAGPDGWEMAAVSAALVLAAAGAVLGWRAAAPGDRWLRSVSAAGLGATLAAAGGGHPALAILILLLLILQAPELYPERRGRRALVIAGALTLVAAAGWGLAGLAAGEGVRETVLGLAGTPGRLLRRLLWPPAVGFLAAATTATVVVRAWRGRSEDGERFLGLAVLGLVAARSALADQSSLRYLADIGPLWELLAACGALLLIGTASSRVSGREPGRPLFAAGVGATVVVVLLLPGTSLTGTWSYLQREPGEAAPAPLHPPVFVPDIEGAVEWVAERRRPGDLVVATDWHTTYCYLGQVDLWIRSQGYAHQSVLVDGRARDIYLGAEVIRTLEELLERAGRQTLWIVAGGVELEVPDRKLSPELREWLQSAEPLFVAGDDATRVLRLGAGDVPAPAGEGAASTRDAVAGGGGSEAGEATP